MLDLYERETEESLARLPRSSSPELGMFDGFVRGSAMGAVRQLAVKGVGRTLQQVGSLGPILYDEAFKNNTGVDTVAEGTSARDRYFKATDDILESATDYWTPRSGEVGVAGEVVGQLIGMLPMILASPPAALVSSFADIGSELARKGIGDHRAQAVAAAQTAGLGAGIWMPLLGSTLWQRLAYGVGANVPQGIVTRGASAEILKDSPLAKEFEALGLQEITIDTLLGLAFGAGTHVIPSWRAQSTAASKRFEAWAQNLQPSEIAALAVLRQAQHANADSLPGKPATPADVQASVERLKAAVEQMERGEPVSVQQIGRPTQDGAEAPPQFEADPVRVREMEVRTQELQAEAKRVMAEEGIREVVEVYHGSPHEFDAFDISKVGTGEGVQAFGHGLYVAENPRVAGAYRLAGTDGQGTYRITKDGVTKQVTLDPAEGRAYQDAASMAATDGQARAHTFLKGELARDDLDAFTRQHLSLTERALLELDGATVERVEGNLYKVEMPKAAIGRMLDWDKPMRDQPQEVQDALRAADFNGDAVVAAWKTNGAWEHISGEVLYRHLAGGLTQGSVARGQDKAASAYLASLGVPGLRYLDQGSRADGDGTRNFVLFDPSHARIVEKNGQKVVQVTEGPPAQRAAAEPPPPGDGGAAVPGRPEVSADPVAAAADAVVQANPDLVLRVGTKADGTPETMTLKEYVEDARLNAKQAREDVRLFEAAAECMLGRG